MSEGPREVEGVLLVRADDQEAAAASSSAGPSTVARRTGVRRGSLAWLLARRMAAMTWLAASRGRWSAPAAAGATGGSGQRARWTEPSRHHDHTSSQA